MGERPGRYFANRTALVTGGARRVGLAIGQAIAREGASVYFTYQSSTRTEVQRAVAALKESGAAAARGIRCDLREIGAVESLVRSIGKQRIDFLVNSAASFTREELFETTPESFDETFALNVRGPFFLAKALAARMKKNGFGRIVNIADVAGIVPWPAYIPYSMSKAAIIAMTKGLARALAPDVLVNAVAPGPVMLPETFDSSAARDAIEPTVLKRSGSPVDVAEAVVFLLRSDYVTGVTLPVDGGRLIR